MIRYLKVLGLCLVAAFALSAVGASGAMATKGKLTADGSFTLDGTDELGALNAFTYPEEPPVDCPDSSYKGSAIGNINGDLTSGAETATLTPEYKQTTCNAEGLKATVTMEGCDYVLHLGETILGGNGTYAVTSDLICPKEKHPIIHIYASATSEAVPICTINITADQTGLKGATLKNTAGGTLTLGGAVAGIHATKEGACGTVPTENASLDLAVEIKGTNSTGGSTEVGISE